MMDAVKGPPSTSPVGVAGEDMSLRLVDVKARQKLFELFDASRREEDRSIIVYQGV